jgi:8-oxo-dGTP pyrophosphatase MutT (NUDIX family)
MPQKESEMNEAKRAAMLSPVYYVLGFGFYDDHLVMIQKDHPADQAGKINGVGGKVKQGENAWQAMSREFMEETGVDLPPSAWTNVGRMIGVDGQGVGFHVEVFCVDDHRCEAARTTESEIVGHWDWQTLLTRLHGRQDVKAMSNIGALIALCRINMSGHGPTFVLTYDE